MIRILLIAVLAWVLFTREDGAAPTVIADLPPDVTDAEDLTAHTHHAIQRCRAVGDDTKPMWICMTESTISGHVYPLLCGETECGLLQ